MDAGAVIGPGAYIPMLILIILRLLAGRLRLRRDRREGRARGAQPPMNRWIIPR